MSLSSVDWAQILRFVVVGSSVTGTFMGLNYLLGRRFAKQTAFLLAYPPAVTLHFFLNKYWTFGDHAAITPMELGQYGLLTGVAFVLQWLAFRLLTAYTRWPGWLASGVATAAQMVVAFLVMKIWVFARQGLGVT